MREKLKKSFDLTVEVVFGVILVILIMVIILGTIQLGLSILHLFQLEGMTEGYIDVIADVLTLYVLVELSRSLVEYFDVHRLRLTYIVDAGIVFVLREILIGLFKHELEPNTIYALAVLMLVLGALRIASVLVYQREKILLEPRRKGSAKSEA